jgi:hypothetical protein
MSIQVEMPKWIAMDKDHTWYVYNEKPKLHNNWFYRCWFSWDQIKKINVTGFTGDWKDSLHQYVDGKWEKV